MQFGFVIDHSRCIGCHACTVACKAENDVPLGSFRTWVKYTEQGEFPSVRRSFAVLRCNQCTDAPCVTICPVRALEKRADGIVDVDPAACIGCKACMQGCPYDALYIGREGTAEKCHFCAHRTDVGLAPACAIVCPTEAIIPGDFDNPESVVSRLRREHRLTARKVEAGTGPNVFYREVSEAGIDPQATSEAGGYLWANRLPGAPLAEAEIVAATRDAEVRARTTYDVDHPRHWGGRVSSYLMTKSLAAGLFLVLPMLLPPLSEPVFAVGRDTVLILLLGAIGFLALTTVLLVMDLKRPARFLYVLTRANWSSWLARGSFVLAAYGAVLTVWVALFGLGGGRPGDETQSAVLVAPAAWPAAAPAAQNPAGTAHGTPEVLSGGIGTLLLVAGAALAALTACYTGWLFGQAKGRVLWMRRGLWLHLIVQAFLAGCAATLLVAPLLELHRQARDRLRWALVVALLAHVLFTLSEGWFAPRRRTHEFRRAARLVTRGPFAAAHWQLGLGAGVLLPLLLLTIAPVPALCSVAAVLVLAGLYVEEDILVRAGQALPIS